MNDSNRFFGSRLFGSRFFGSNITVPLALTTILIAVLLISGCSAVFDAGLSGKIVDSDSGEGIPDVQIYAYTEESLRDKDFNEGKGAVTGPDGVKLYFSPSSAGNYIPATTTADDGSFTINRLIWKTLSPAFGKTADYLDVYLLYFHSDYGLNKENSQVTIVSDSNNASRVNAELTSRLKTKRVQINIKDVADDEIADTAFEVKVRATINGKSEPYRDYSTDVTGTAAITVPYLANKAEGESTVNITVSIPQDSTWQWVDASTDDYYRAAGDYSITVTDDELRGEAAISKTAYVKGYEFDYPAFSGMVATESDKTTSYIGSSSDAYKNDGITVWLARVKSTAADGTVKLEVMRNCEKTTAPDGNGANSAIITHGLFSRLGEGVSWKPALEESGSHAGDYSGAVATTVVYLIIDSHSAGTQSVPDIDDYFHRIVVRCTDPATRNLEKISVGNNKAHKANAGDPAYKIDAEITFED